MLTWPLCDRTLPLLLGCDQMGNLGRARSGHPDFATHWRSTCPLGLGFPVQQRGAMRVMLEKALAGSSVWEPPLSVAYSWEAETETSASPRPVGCAVMDGFSMACEGDRGLSVHSHTSGDTEAQSRLATRSKSQCLGHPARPRVFADLVQTDRRCPEASEAAAQRRGRGCQRSLDGEICTKTPKVLTSEVRLQNPSLPAHPSRASREAEAEMKCKCLFSHISPSQT